MRYKIFIMDSDNRLYSPYPESFKTEQQAFLFMEKFHAGIWFTVLSQSQM